MTAEPVVYRLNGHDEITIVNDAWTRFALANCAPELAPALVVGRVVWDFIADLTTQHLYRQLRARAGRECGALQPAL